jgi:hypothetical protein
MVTALEMELARRRRKKVWPAHCRDGKTIRELWIEYRVSEACIRNDLYKWTAVIGEAAAALSYPYLEIAPMWTDIYWQRLPKVMRLVYQGKVLYEGRPVNLREGYMLLVRHLKELGIPLESYPFDPDAM